MNEPVTCGSRGAGGVLGAEQMAPLRARIDALASEFKLPACAVALVVGEGTVLHAYGHACLPHDVPATPDTLFHTASVGKHFTAIALLRLLSRRGLSPSEPIGRFLDDIPQDWRDRTISSLLRHTSGIPDYGHRDFDITKPHTRAEVIAAADRPLTFPADAAWAYSNTNYMLAGYIVEALGGEDFGHGLTREVLAPAGLKTARPDNAEAVIPLRADGYLLRNGAHVHAPRMDGAYSGYADGPLLMSARDAGVWLRAIMDGSIIPTAFRKAFAAPSPIGGGLSVPYGFGVFTDALRGKALLSHTGGLPGYTSFFAWMPERRLAIAVLSNVTLQDSRVQRFIGHTCLELAVPGSTALSLPPVDDTHPDWTAEFARLVSRGAEPVPPDRLAPSLRRVMEAGAGDRLFTNRAHCPPLQEVEVVEERSLGPGLMRRYRLRHTDLVEHVSVGYAPDGRIFWVFPD